MQINLTRAQQLLPLALGSAPISPPERVRRLCLTQMRQPCCDCRNFWGRRTGVRLTIPMAGHPIAAAEEVGARGEAEALEALVRAHHCVFLLTDTRESRWLPSLLCASAGVLAINAALGFDRCRRPPPFPRHLDANRDQTRAIRRRRRPKHRSRIYLDAAASPSISVADEPMSALRAGL